MHRRQFLKLGLVGSAVLSATSLTAVLSGCTDTVNQSGEWKVLRTSDRVFFTAIAPVMLKGSLPQNPQARAEGIQVMLRNIDQGIWLQGPHNQKQLTDLLNLLNFAPARYATTGVWDRWEDANEADIEAFLNRWRDSSLGLFNLAFNGLNKLMCVTWFSQPMAWPAIGYPGPKFPELLTR